MDGGEGEGASNSDTRKAKKKCALRKGKPPPLSSFIHIGSRTPLF